MAFDRRTIQAEHDRLGLKMGWRFLMCRERNLEGAPAAVISVQPGGSGPHGSYENGCAYVDECWPARPSGRMQPPGRDKLQVQVQQMFGVLGVDPNDVLCGYFVPFRSPNWSDFPSKEEAIAFGRNLWRWAFETAKPETVVVIGKEIGPEIEEILGVRDKTSISIGWGNYTGEKCKFGDGKSRLIILPHLSRFAIFGRPQSAAGIKRLFS